MPLTSRVPVGLFMTAFWPGGTERQMLELVRRLDRSRFSVHVACFHRRGTWLSRAEHDADSVTEFPISGFRSPATLGMARQFARWCRAKRLGVLHACDLYANIFALPTAALAGVPVRVANRREVNPNKTAGQILAQRAAYAFAHRVVANCGAAAARLRREGVARRRIVEIPNGIDVDEFRPPDRPASLRRLVIAARLRPEKGHDTLIDALPAVVGVFPDVVLTIVGDGPTAAALAERVAARRLSGQVRFEGHRDDVALALREQDVFVLPSRSEAFPNSIIEAMATGMPVVASAVGGIPELVEHGRNGLLVPPDRPDELARSIVDLLKRPSYALALGRKARVDVVARYSFERMVRRFEALYLAQLGDRTTVSELQSQSQPATL